MSIQTTVIHAMNHSYISVCLTTTEDAETLKKEGVENVSTKGYRLSKVTYYHFPELQYRLP